MIITISGKPGSGKSTLARNLALKLGMRHYSIGDLRRKWAREKGMSLADLNKIGEKELWTDRQADDFQKELGKNEDNFVIDSRLGFHFIPESYKIFLDVDLREAAMRIFRDKRHGEQAKTQKEVERMLEQRQQSDISRYRKYYAINPFSAEHYDLVFDTTGLKPEETLKDVLKKIQRNCAGS